MARTKIKTADITADAVTAAEIAADAVGASELADDAVASANIIDGAIVNADINNSAAIATSKITGLATSATTDTTNASNISSGTLSSARMGSGTASATTVLYGDGSWKAEPVTDTAGLKDDIALLAFKTQANGSLARYNLIDQSVDAFEDASGIDASASTNETRNVTSNFYSGTTVSTGGTITTHGAYTVHSFTSVGDTTFTAGKAGSAAIMVVAGGGAGAGLQGGGGGGGGIVEDASFSVLQQAYTVTVGAGGNSAPSAQGGNSVWDSGSAPTTMTALGGGYGDGQPGGSGAGGDYLSNPAGTSTQGDSGGGTGYGYGGGTGARPNSNNLKVGGGGGGAGATGNNNSGGTAGAGGSGRSNDWRTGSGVYYAGGGGGGGSTEGGTSGGAGGSGGGGAGAAEGPAGTPGTANTGGGGGCGGGGGKGDGGSGIVVIRYTTGALNNYANMTLVSNAVTAEAVPTKGDIVMTYSNGAGTATVNTDVVASVSRDNGTTYTAATLASQGTTGGHTVLTAHDIDISGQPSGSAMRWKVVTANQDANKYTNIQAVSLGWS